MSTPTRKSPQDVADDVRVVFPEFDAATDAGTFAYQLAHTDASDEQVGDAVVAAFDALQPQFRLYAILTSIHARNTSLVAALLANSTISSMPVDLEPFDLDL